MARSANNAILQKAKKAKSDEFYTQYCDIERELQHYNKHFKGKVVYCNCDDPSRSNFVKYFTDNFHALGLKKIIATCYVEQSANLFEDTPANRASYLIYDEKGEHLLYPNANDSYLRGDGDFRSPECVNFLKEADIIVTNPPFSLFRDFVSQLIKYEKKFLIIGNINAITYKEIFNLIQANKIWLGVHLGRGISGFIVPDDYELYGTETTIDAMGNRIISTNNCLWLTNLDTPNRNENITLTKSYKGSEEQYPTYDNCNGINVNKTSDIPKDYAGLMGVPITFLHKYNPNQFEIIRFRKGDNDKDLSINGKCPYFRILIKNKYLGFDGYWGLKS